MCNELKWLLGTFVHDIFYTMYGKGDDALTVSTTYVDEISIALESIIYPGQFVGMLPDGSVRVSDGDAHSRFVPFTQTSVSFTCLNMY